jgi:hypothetical protein
VEAHEELHLAYTDPFTMRKKRAAEERKQISKPVIRVTDRDAVKQFCRAIRKQEGFFRKATDQELEGIYERLTPEERQKYLSKSNKSPSVKSSPVAALPPKKSKLADFINDELVEDHMSDLSSDDVSLVSESDVDLGDPELPVKAKKDKKHKKEKKQKKSSPEQPAPSKPSLQKFAWT